MVSWVGINLAGGEFSHVFPGKPNTDYFIPSHDELDYYHSKKLNYIRLPFRAERMQPAIGGPLDPTYLGFYTDLVDYAGTLGMHVILDMHNYGGYLNETGPNAGVYSVFGGVLKGVPGPVWAQLDFENLWIMIAQAFAGKPGLYGYDLMNEPYGFPAGVWQTYAQGALDAIRTVDTTSQALIQWEPDFPLQRDANCIYDIHVYLDHDNSGTNYDWLTNYANGGTVNDGVNRLTAFAAWCKANTRQGVVGECGCPQPDPTGNWSTALVNMLKFCQANGIAFIYWAGGRAWGTYPLSCEPITVTLPQVNVLDIFAK